jgi:hypothetical protein
MKKYLMIPGAALFIGLAAMSFSSGSESAPAVADFGQEKELPKMKNEAFKRGELLSFRLHYGIIDAGTATLGITEEAREIAGRKTYHMVGIGASKGTFDFFYKVRDRYETYIDEEALVPWVFVRRVNEGGYKIEQDYVFNRFQNKVSVGGGETFSVEPNMQDMLSAFYHARAMDLSSAKPGDIFEIKCFMDKEVWPLKIKFINRENVTTDAGTFRCLKFRPIVQQGRVFKKEEDLNIWITDDKNHIPVKGQADVLVGSIKMELTDYKGLANPVAKVN